jgi:hypothetical protein
LVVVKTLKVKDGVEERTYAAKKVGIDHYARLTAVARLINLSLAGRPMPKPIEKSVEDRPITFEQFTRLLESYRDKSGKK